MDLTINAVSLDVDRTEEFRAQYADGSTSVLAAWKDSGDETDWLLGAGVIGFMQAADHWIAMGLLVFIGGKMIYESFRNEGETPEKGDPTSGLTLLALAVATSIDAFVVGLSFGLLRSEIFLPSVIIGLVTAAFSLTGMKIGNLVGGKFGRRVEILGGVILIAIG